VEGTLTPFLPQTVLVSRIKVDAMNQFASFFSAVLLTCLAVGGTAALAGAAAATQVPEVKVVRAGNVELHYVEQGHGVPVVFVHGSVDDYRSFEPQMRQMSEIILQGSQLVLEAVPLLSSISRNAARLNTLTAKIIAIEEHADDICNQGVKSLFVANRADNNPGNAMNFIIGSEMYDHLEKVVDRIEDVSNEINAIVIDHL